MSSDVRVWAVDVSTFALWTEADARGCALIERLINDTTEQTKIRRFVREIDQIRSLAGKILVRLAVCTTFADVRWSELQFDVSPQGRPFLASPKRPFDFNITHDGDWVALAFSACRPSSPAQSCWLGVDVMEVQLPSFEESVESFVDTMDMTLTKREREWIMESSIKNEDENEDGHDEYAALMTSSSLSPLECARLVRLYTLWTYKEAFTKAHGLGLSFDFAKIELAMWKRKLEDEKTFVFTSSGSPAFSSCVFRDIILPPGRKHEERVTMSPGRGTGQGSLLVLATLTESSSTARQVPLHILTKQQAEHEDLLTCFQMSDLIGAAIEKVSEKVS